MNVSVGLFDVSTIYQVRRSCRGVVRFVLLVVVPFSAAGGTRGRGLVCCFVGLLRECGWGGRLFRPLAIKPRVTQGRLARRKAQSIFVTSYTSSLEPQLYSTLFEGAGLRAYITETSESSD